MALATPASVIKRAQPNAPRHPPSHEQLSLASCDVRRCEYTKNLIKQAQLFKNLKVAGLV